MTHVEAQRSKDTRYTAKQAVYMELRGAEKDADCEKVRVNGGVSTKLGCCNYFEPELKTTAQFRCGTCAYVEPED